MRTRNFIQNARIFSVEAKAKRIHPRFALYNERPLNSYGILNVARSPCA